MRTILFLIALLYIAVVLSMIDSRLDNLNNTVKIQKVYKIPNDVKAQFYKVINR